MSDFNPKQGEMILVSSTGVYFDVGERVFVCRYNNGYLCEYEDDPHKYVIWPHAKPLSSEPEPIPFTRETWPKQVVWVRNKDWAVENSSLVTGLYKHGVEICSENIRFEKMRIAWEMSIDFCQTWQPCHYTPTE